MASEIEYPPYVSGYGLIPKLFGKIREAAVPPKVTQDFVSTALGLKSTSYRAMIPLLKKLGFLDQANVPTQAYKDFRDESLSGTVMAQRLREAYKALFAANEYAQRLGKKELEDKLRSLSGAGKDDPNIGNVAATFLELSKMAAWDGTAPKPKKETEQPSSDVVGTAAAATPGAVGAQHRSEFVGRLGISYTINLNLPATTEIEVFNAIFKSLRENLLRES